MNTRYSTHCQLIDLLDAADSLRETRHRLHRQPELSFKEAVTSSLVATRLAQWGWDVTRHVGGHGVVGTLKVGDGKRAVAIRADMDALPIVEESDRPWASEVAGVMHACGHDGNAANLLGVAATLLTEAHDLPVCVKLVLPRGSLMSSMTLRNSLGFMNSGWSRSCSVPAT